MNLLYHIKELIDRTISEHEELHNVRIDVRGEYHINYKPLQPQSLYFYQTEHAPYVLYFHRGTAIIQYSNILFPVKEKGWYYIPRMQFLSIQTNDAQASVAFIQPYRNLYHYRGVNDGKFNQKTSS